MDLPLTNDPLVERVADALYAWDKLLFNRLADRYGAARVAVDTLRQIAEELEKGELLK